MALRIKNLSAGIVYMIDVFSPPRLSNPEGLSNDINAISISVLLHFRCVIDLTLRIVETSLAGLHTVLLRLYKAPPLPCLVQRAESGIPA